MTQKISLDTKRKQVQKYMKSKGYEVVIIEKGILNVASGTTGAITVQKNNVVRLKR